VRLFSTADLALAVGLGLVVLAVVAAIYGWCLAQGAGEEHARTLAFAALVCGNLGLILANRSRHLTSLELLARPNAAWWWIVGAALAALLAVIYVPAAAAVFRFAPVGAAELALAAAAGAAAVLPYDLVKLFRRLRPPPPGTLSALI
jgi:Ca2+-transporting ATPase